MLARLIDRQRLLEPMLARLMTGRGSWAYVSQTDDRQRFSEPMLARPIDRQRFLSLC